MTFLIRDIIQALTEEAGLGTFLELKFSMSTRPCAVYTHGRIQFDDVADLEKWWRTRRGTTVSA